MKVNLDVAGIVFYAIYKRFTNIKNTNNKTKNVLFLINENGIGDVICTLDLIKRIDEIYPPEDNYEIFFGVDQGIYNFLEKIHYTLKHHFIILDVGFESINKRKTFPVFLKNFEKLNSFKWERIVTYKRIGLFIKLLIMGLCANHIELVEYEFHKSRCDWDAVVNCFLKNLRIYYFKESEMLFSLYEKAIYFFTQKKICLKPPVIPLLGEAPPRVGSRKYCIISCGIGANHPFLYRNWPADRFASVISFIDKELELDIYLCGDQNDVENTELILKYVKSREHVFNLVGKTRFNQWIELTRHAEFVFGNDSGYIHVAAAVGTLAFVLMGYWNYGRFHPYQLSEVKNDYQAPIVLKTSLCPACEFCSIYEFIKASPKAQKAKRDCEAQVERTGVYQCINDISAEYVIAEIERHVTNGRQMLEETNKGV